MAMFTLPQMISRLTKGFVKFTGRKPDGLEKIKIKQEALERIKQQDKVVDMEGNVIDTSKGIMGGKEMKAVGGRIGLKGGTYDRNSFEHKINELKSAYKRYKKGSSTGGRGGIMTFEQFAPLFAAENFAIGGRVGYKDGPDVPGRRKFMKIMGGLATIPFVGKFFKGAKTAAPAVEKAAEVAGQAPSYFFDLVAKIKLLGEPRRTPSYRDRVNEYQYTGKDGNEYLLTEELDTGDIMIQKDKLGGRNYGDESYEVIEDRTEMVYRKGQADETTKGTPADDYEEYKVEFDQDGTMADATDIDEISKSEIIKEATGDAKSIKKAGGGIAKMLGE